MSKLIDSIKEIKTGKRSISPVVDFSEERKYSSATGGLLDEYSCTAKIGVTISLADPETYPTSAKETFRTAKQMIAEEVFGEFRGPLLELRMRMYASGDIVSGKMLDAVLDQMFKV